MRRPIERRTMTRGAARVMAATTFMMLAAMSGAAPEVVAAQSTDPVAIADSLARTIHRGSITGNAATLQDARTLATRGLVAHPEHPLLVHHQAAALYREASLLMESDPDDAQELLDEAQGILDEAVEQLETIPETHALRASVMGMRITGMMRAMTLGPQTGNAIEQAMEADPENPNIWLASGIGTLHKPGFLGGGADNALEELQRGEALLSGYRPEAGHPVSGGAEIQAWIGIAHMQADRPQEAVAAFRTALEREPDFGWVSELLLPAAERLLAGGSR